MFFSGEDIQNSISNSLLDGKESFNYSVLYIKNKGLFGIEIEPDKLKKIKGLEKIMKNAVSEIDELKDQSKLYYSDRLKERMKIVFGILKKYNLLNAVHFYRKDKNGKWVE